MTNPKCTEMVCDDEDGVVPHMVWKVPTGSEHPRCYDCFERHVGDYDWCNYCLEYYEEGEEE